MFVIDMNLKIDWHCPSKAIVQITIAFALIVSVLDIFGFLENYLWIKERILPIILLFLALFAIFEMEYHEKTNNEIRDSTNNLKDEIRTLQGDVRHFENMTELYNHISEKLNTAKGVNDVTWGYPNFSNKAERIAYDKYLEIKKQFCKKDDIKYREVSSLTGRNYFQWSKGIIHEGFDGYHLSYHDIRFNRILLISFIIIDSKEIIFYRHEGEFYLGISHPMFINLFKDYFEALWVSSTKIKDGDMIYKDKLVDIEKNRETLSSKFDL